MEVLAWFWWVLIGVLGFAWSLVWFLIGGWASTLLQIAILVVGIYVLKYGWRQAPFELWHRTRSFGSFFWNWLRARDLAAGPRREVRETVRVVKTVVRTKEFGDVNVSTLLSLVMFGGLLLVSLR
ncbi:MAG: hypothetical protein ACREC6_08910 [Hyphomicrobiaceae bacterium]